MPVKSKPKMSWRDKMSNGNGLPKIQKIHDSMRKKWGTGTMVIPAPREVNGVMKGVPEGKLITINHLRELLAKKHGTTIACPITIGMFAWMAAFAAEEGKSDGEIDTTPYWRTLKSGGVINDKFPGGLEAQIKLLENEGHKIIRKRKNCIVANYEQFIVTNQ
jgi:hypothetical protein